MILKNPPKPPPLPPEHCSIRDIEWPNTRNMAKPLAERPLYIDDRGILYRKVNLAMLPDNVQTYIASEEEIFKGQFWGVLPETPKPEENRAAPFQFKSCPVEFPKDNS